MRDLGLVKYICMIGQLYNVYAMKLLLQKRTNNDALVRKSPRMYYDMGLQWELSGNQVVCCGNTVLSSLKGNRKVGNDM